MGKIKKIKGGNTPFVSDDEEILLTTSSRNTVYVYNLKTGKLMNSFKTVSNVSHVAMSPDKRLIAAKNTIGHMALVLAADGTEIFRNKMKEREGWGMRFLQDSDSVLDIDWSGRTMVLDCKSGEAEVLDQGSNHLPRADYMHIDRFSGLIYKFMADNYGYSSGVVMVSPADPNRIKYEPIKLFPELLPDHFPGISFCKTHNYHVDKENCQIVMTDKKFEELKRIEMPEILKQEGYFPKGTFISPSEKYVFFTTYKQLSLLYRLDSMKLVGEFDYEYVSNFTMIEDDTRFIITTWSGSYIGNVNDIGQIK